MINIIKKLAVSWLRQLVAGLLLRRPGLNPKPFHVRVVVDKVALGQAFVRVLQFPPVRIIPPMLHTHSLITDTIYS